MKKHEVNKKVLLGIMAMLLLVAIIVITSFIPFIIDPSKFLTLEFLTNELIVVAIVVISMVCMIFVGQAQNGGNPNSEIAKARRHFNETIKLITNKNRFFQWIRQVQQPNDLKQIRIREMQKVGIERYELIDLSISEIKSLLNANQHIGDKYYKQLTKTQVNALITLKTTNKINAVQPTYYLTNKTIDSDKTITEKSANESKKKNSMLTFSIMSKVVMTVLTAMIFTSLVFDVSSKQEIMNGLAQFFSRLMSMVSSAYMGFIVGSQINDIDADYIEMKCLVHEQYNEDKNFIALDENELIKKEFEENGNREQRTNNEQEGTNTETNILD